MSKARPILEDIPEKPLVVVLPSTAPDDSRFSNASRLETREHIDEGIASGRITAINTQTAPPPIVPALTKGPRRANEISLGTKVPDYVLRELKVKAAERGVTMRYLILTGLRSVGITVNDVDMSDARKDRR